MTADKVDVLVVDDNPVILSLLGSALRPIAAVTTVASATEALKSVTAKAPDLIIADFNMPAMDGRELISMLRAMTTTARTPILLMASKTDQSEKLGAIRDCVEEILTKPFFMNEAVSRIKRVVDKIKLEKLAHAAQADGSGVRGSLVQMSVIDLLQSLELGRKTAKLTVSNGTQTSVMYFVDGELTHAVNADIRGDEAVYRALMWNEGTWELKFDETAGERTTTRSTQGLLMEGLRLFDEANRDRAEGGEAGDTKTGFDNSEDNVLDV